MRGEEGGGSERDMVGGEIESIRRLWFIPPPPQRSSPVLSYLTV